MGSLRFLEKIQQQPVHLFRLLLVDEMARRTFPLEFLGVGAWAVGKVKDFYSRGGLVRRGDFGVGTVLGPGRRNWFLGARPGERGIAGPRAMPQDQQWEQS